MNRKPKAHKRVDPLKDTFKRFPIFSNKPELSKIYLEPTTHCNLQCRTCIRNSWDEPIGAMNITVYRKLLTDLKEFKTIKSIAFWGIGEPLAHPEIIKMVSLAHETGLKTEMITNGHLLNKNMAQGLIQAGLDTLIVSVDASTQETFMDIRQGGDLLRVEENIQRLNMLRKKMAGKNPDVGVEFVIMKSNIDQLPDLAQKTKSMEVDFIILTNLLPCTEDMKDEILYYMSATLHGENECSKWSQELMLPVMDLQPEYLNPVRELLKNMARPMPERRDIPNEYFCPFVQKGSVAITWSGDVSPCIALMHSYRCYILGREKFIKRYLVGNITLEKISTIWNKNNYLSFRERVFHFDFSPCIQCSGCDYSETNEEDCFGNTHPVCGDCLWARSILLCP